MGMRGVNVVDLLVKGEIEVGNITDILGRAPTVATEAGQVGIIHDHFGRDIQPDHRHRPIGGEN